MMIGLYDFITPQNWRLDSSYKQHEQKGSLTCPLIWKWLVMTATTLICDLLSFSKLLLNVLNKNVRKHLCERLKDRALNEAVGGKHRVRTQ